MKKNWKIFASLLLVGLLAVNIVLFSRSIVIGDSVAKLESNIHEMKLSNMELQQKLYTINSLDNLSQLATQMGFTKEAQPINLDNVTYALAQ